MFVRCAWAGNDPLYIRYHDEEWGVPVRDDDRHLFEMLILEGAQAGLSWITVLRKRDAYRAAFDNFDAEKVAGYDANRVALLLQNPAIIRNRAKVEAAVQNARGVLRLRDEFGSLGAYLWRFVNNEPIVNHWATLADLPAQTTESQAMSKDLKRRGFNFVGPTICYSLMQAVGMVNDHVTDCFRHSELAK